MSEYTDGEFIADLPKAEEIGDDDIFVVEDSEATKKTTAETAKNYFSADVQKEISSLESRIDALYDYLEIDKVAFAVYDETNGSLVFYSDIATPEVGSSYKGQTVSELYTGIENTGSGYATVPWRSVRSNVRSVKFDESFAIICVETLSGWFYGFSSCESIDLKNLNTSNAASMEDMFYGGSALAELDLSLFDTSSVTNMASMFRLCSGLTELDLSAFDTGSVTNMTSMLRDCTGLKTIYSDDSKFVIDKVTKGSYMFNGCSNLVGGAGTAYDSSKVTHEMAHVDTEDNPGYFTAKDA